jgi:hypothetical protein
MCVCREREKEASYIRQDVEKMLTARESERERQSQTDALKATHVQQ